MTTNQSNRRDFLRTMGAGSLALGGLATGISNQAWSAQKPNIVFILVDDLGWSDLGCYGADLHETPNIDAFARKSLRFTDAYAASPICSPTRASIMTGKYPARLNMTVWREQTLRPPSASNKMIPPQCVSDLPHDEITIAETLKKAGYTTAHVGKWHLGDADHYPETQGFDVNIGGTHWGAPQTYFYPYNGWRNEDEFRYVPHLELGKEGEYLTDRLTDEALSLMEKMKDGPFYLNLAFHTVHTPIEGKKDLVEHFRSKIKPDMHHQHPGYAAMVKSLDENVGRVLKKIETLGIADNTIVFLFSDNGGYINKKDDIPVTDNTPLRSGKGSLYEGGIREPLLVHWPGVTKPGTECHQPVCSVDFYPTICQMVGVQPEGESGADGIGLKPLLDNPKADIGRDTLYWHYPHYYFYPKTKPIGAIRKGSWKLLEHFEEERIELFNLEDDLGESKDLAQERPDKVKELLADLKAWRNSVDAKMAIPNPDYAG